MRFQTDRVKKILIDRYGRRRQFKVWQAMDGKVHFKEYIGHEPIGWQYRVDDIETFTLTPMQGQ